MEGGMFRWVLIVGVMAGCLPVMPVSTPVGDCGAAALQGLVGQSAGVLEGMRFGQPVRIIRPGMVVTMDYSESRLNIEIDGAEVIVRVKCG
jgi:hypothetical protein